MRWILFALAGAVLVGGMAWADETDLSAGVFICHYDSRIAWSSDAPAGGWCSFYEASYAIDDTEDQNPSIMTTDHVVWFVLSAWAETKTWCGTEFGFEDYDEDLFVFESWDPCAPGEVLEIPSAGWPGPLTGTGIVTTDVPWSGAIEPVYFFTGYSYAGSGQISIAPDPPTGLVGWGNCSTPPILFAPTCRGKMGIMTAGTECHPPTDPIGACCFDDYYPECAVLTEADCAAFGGTFLGEGVTCAGDPCPAVWACCVGSECLMRTEDLCTALNGTWHQVERCAETGGEYVCPSTPTAPGSWGRIKSLYR